MKISKQRIDDAFNKYTYDYGEDHQKIIFTLKPLTAIDKINVAVLFETGRPSDAQEILLKKCVIGWSNLTDENDKEIPFTFDSLIKF